MLYREIMEITNVQDNNYAKLGVSANPVYSSLRKFERVRSYNEIRTYKLYLSFFSLVCFSVGSLYSLIIVIIL